MEVFPNGDAFFRKIHPEYARLQDLYDKFWEGELSEAEQNELEKLDEVWGNEYTRLNKRLLDGNAHLIDIIRHDVLFENYPQLNSRFFAMLTLSYYIDIIYITKGEAFRLTP